MLDLVGNPEHRFLSRRGSNTKMGYSSVDTDIADIVPLAVGGTRYSQNCVKGLSTSSMFNKEN